MSHLIYKVTYSIHKCIEQNIVYQLYCPCDCPFLGWIAIVPFLGASALLQLRCTSLSWPPPLQPWARTFSSFVLAAASFSSFFLPLCKLAVNPLALHFVVILVRTNNRNESVDLPTTLHPTPAPECPATPYQKRAKTKPNTSGKNARSFSRRVADDSRLPPLHEQNPKAKPN